MLVWSLSLSCLLILLLVSGLLLSSWSSSLSSSSPGLYPSSSVASGSSIIGNSVIIHLSVSVLKSMSLHTRPLRCVAFFSLRIRARSLGSSATLSSGLRLAARIGIRLS